MLGDKKFVEVQYIGVSGRTNPCKRAIINFVHSGMPINEVKILTDNSGSSNKHAFLIISDCDNLIAVKSGFTSGYNGGGPRGYSYVLALLSQYTQNIGEYIVPVSIFERLDECKLTFKDIKQIFSIDELRPARWYDQIVYHSEDNPDVFHEFPLTLPLALIDDRLIKIALTFSENPDNAILNAYRKIESIVKA